MCSSWNGRLKATSTSCHDTEGRERHLIFFLHNGETLSWRSNRNIWYGFSVFSLFVVWLFDGNLSLSPRFFFCRWYLVSLKTHVVQPANGLHLSSNRQREMDSPSSISAIHISSTATTAPVQYTRNTRGGGAKISPTGNASLRRPSSNSSSLKREGSPPAGETGSSSTNITANHGNNFYNGNGRGNGSGNGRSNGSANGRDRGSRNGGNNHSDRAARIRTRAGLTRGERIVATHRYYSMHEAAEVLRRSPLPEGVVWKKMRQIVWARLGRVPALESGGGITNSRSNGTEIGMKSQKYRWYEWKLHSKQRNV